MGIILIAVGLILTMVDINVASTVAYPAFNVNGDVGKFALSPSIQKYTVENILGTSIRFDIFSDVIGLALLLVGVILVIKHNKQYFYAIPVWIAAVAALVCLRFSGYFEQGPWLVIWIFLSYFGLFAAKVLLEYIILYSTIISTDVHVNRGTNTRILFCWWIGVGARVFIVLLTFVGHFTVAYIYKGFLIGIAIIVAYNLIKTREYIGQSEIIKFKERKLRDKNGWIGGADEKTTM
ncbi:hypothetical protein [Eubacterium xylanophilum]|uniref:hypothetical protein n=1 Tax=Eubacterium xylanophilum TaxID=39497 RepID=UPI00047E2D78|nr:hypothetical protein [Eubacterium xylanophilum]